MRSLQQSLRDTPVVFVQGPRQAGKTTLVKSLKAAGHDAHYLTLDDATVLAAAHQDPHGFIDGLGGPAIIDEVQRAPALFLAIKASVDRDRRPGRFTLTGSTNVLLLPKLSESLVGRMELLTLWPFSQGEVQGVCESFVDAAFSDTLPTFHPPRINREELLSRVVVGGFPEVTTRKSGSRQRAWFGSYVTTILQRDVRDLANINGLTELPRLLGLLASRVGQLLNYSDVARSIPIPQSTLKRYLALLQGTFLVQPIPAWFTNTGKRLVKAPKLLMCDTGLVAGLLSVDPKRLDTDPELDGRLLENFVAMELCKQVGWNETRPSLFHYRTHGQREVDLVLEDAAGRIVGIEVKSSARVTASDLNGLRDLAETAGDRFLRGIVLYLGEQAVPFGPDLHALPVASLWSGTSDPRE